MGGCLAKLFGGRNASLTEMVSATHKHFDDSGNAEASPDTVAEQNIKLSNEMSSPSINIVGNVTVKGNGLALADTSVEQDSAYWEWFIEDLNSSGKGLVKFGVCTKKNAEFYKALEENQSHDEINTGDNMTILMREVPLLKQGDTVGVAVQQSDLPMIQFFHNGDQKYELSINRFRGTVFPALYMDDGASCTATLVFKEADFRYSTPSSRFQPLMAERSIV